MTYRAYLSETPELVGWDGSTRIPATLVARVWHVERRELVLVGERVLPDGAWTWERVADWKEPPKE